MSDPAAGPPGRAGEGHWERIYLEKDAAEMSWTQSEPRPSLELLEESSLPPSGRVLDVGGGDSRLVDHLLDQGLRPGVLDISAQALERCRARLGRKAGRVEWVHGSVLDYRPSEPWDAWHDRAVLHFFVDDSDRRRYLAALRASLAPGGVVVVATFGPDGPRSCSGLPVHRYDAAGLADLVGRAFEPERFLEVEHRTPWGDAQPFLYGRFRRRSVEG